MATEKRLIDANALTDEWNTLIKKMRKDSDGAYPVDFAIVISAVSKVNTVEAVEVVRCKDCKNWLRETISCELNSYLGARERPCWYEEDFCSYGERRSIG